MSIKSLGCYKEGERGLIFVMDRMVLFPDINHVGCLLAFYIRITYKVLSGCVLTYSNFVVLHKPCAIVEIKWKCSTTSSELLTIHFVHVVSNMRNLTVRPVGFFLSDTICGETLFSYLELMYT